jgi:hypothetical protein
LARWRFPISSLDSDPQYQTLRSVSDSHVFVICREGRFYEDLPDDVRRRGPWQGMRRGEVAHLRPELWLDLEEQGYVFVRSELVTFRPEC